MAYLIGHGGTGVELAGRYGRRPGAVHPDGPPGSTGAGLPSALAPPERHAHVPGEEDADGEARAERLEAGAPGELAPRSPTSNRTPTNRSRTPTCQEGTTVRTTLGAPGTLLAGTPRGARLELLGERPRRQRRGVNGPELGNLVAPGDTPVLAGSNMPPTPPPAPPTSSCRSPSSWMLPRTPPRGASGTPRCPPRYVAPDGVRAPPVVGRSSGLVRRGCPPDGRWGEGLAWDGSPLGASLAGTAG